MRIIPTLIYTVLSLFVFQLSGKAHAEHPLLWKQLTEEAVAKVGETNVVLGFSFKNTGDVDVVIRRVATSCGCTTPRMPTLPWTIGAGETGKMEIDVDIRGRNGVLNKGLTIESTPGPQVLTVKVTIPKEVSDAWPVQTNIIAFKRAAPVVNAADREKRNRNLLMALADRQAVFRGDCARCHAGPTRGKMGEELYTAACGICHESPHRASMVPDLKFLAHPNTEDYWRKWVEEGKVGSLMPAFGKEFGGPLEQKQIESLVQYLNQTFKH